MLSILITIQTIISIIFIPYVLIKDMDFITVYLVYSSISQVLEPRLIDVIIQSSIRYPCMLER